MTSISTIIGDCDLLRFLYLAESTGYLPELAHYIEETIERYNQEFGSWQRELEEKSPYADATGDLREEWDAWMDLDGQFLTSEFPRRLRYDFVITAYAVWFRKLDAFCSLAAEKLKLEYVRKLDHELENAQSFLKDIVKLKPLADEHWKEFKLVRKLRNKLVHNDGFIPNDIRRSLQERESYWATVATKRGVEAPFLSYGSDGRVTVHPSYCQVILSHMDSFFYAIYKPD